MLITSFHPISFPKLLMKLKCTLCENCRSISSLIPVTENLLMNYTSIPRYHGKKGLGILPDCYPGFRSPLINTISANTAITLLTKTLLLTVFDGMIRAMDSEQFHIHLSSNAKLFCVTSPRSIPFAYCDKLAARLQQQHIILQLLNIIIGVLPLWSFLRRIVTHSQVCGLVTLELLCETKKMLVPLPG